MNNQNKIFSFKIKRQTKSVFPNYVERTLVVLFMDASKCFGLQRRVCILSLGIKKKAYTSVHMCFSSVALPERPIRQFILNVKINSSTA